jgi:hypothetical protein
VSKITEVFINLSKLRISNPVQSLKPYRNCTRTAKIRKQPSLETQLRLEVHHIMHVTYIQVRSMVLVRYLANQEARRDLRKSKSYPYQVNTNTYSNLEVFIAGGP